jgi:hypothetical protein
MSNAFSRPPRRLALITAGLILLPLLARPARAASRDRYLAYARASADWTYAHKDEILAQWKKTFDPLNVFGYRAPGGLLEMAVIYSYLYEKDKTPAYAARAKEVLLSYGDFRSAYPDSSIKSRADYAAGVPALPDFFTAMRYIRTFDTLRRLGRLSPAEERTAADLIAGSMRYLLQTAEWGPMNRSALRAESLAWAVRALPAHADSPKWEMQRRALGDDSWGNWQIEDATIYNGVWLYSLLGYADALNKIKDLFATPEMYYYAQYYLNLFCPAGVVPDLGDAHWTSNWTHFLVYFEAAAAALKDPGLKWAAGTIADKFVDFSKPTSSGLGAMLLDAYRWGSDAVKPAMPTALSMEVMEDVQGKKIVFRNGWSPLSSYLLLNYRDEGDGGLNFRDYLRDTIPVEEEKMTHGHADENSIVLLMSGGSVLLHDGGYRDYMPSGPFGAYRQDYFHNRLCVRPEKIFWGQKAGEFRYSVRDAVPGQSMLEFMHNAGSYRAVRTRKVDFLTFDDFDYSRTRVIDEGWGYQADRVVVALKDPECYIVFDVFKALREDYFTMGAFWHTRKIFDRGEHGYDTGYDQIQTAVLPQDKRLLILFPSTEPRMEGVEAEKRHYQDEWLIHQSWAQHFELGETCAFVSVLVPHGAAEDVKGWPGRVSIAPAEPARGAIGVTIKDGGRDILVGIKNDLRQDMSRDFRRPRYTYEAGRIKLGGVETDGDFVFASDRGGALDYTIVNLTKASYRGRTLIEGGEGNYGLGYDGRPDRGGIGKMRYWRDKAVAR